jgi:hypothetical protein
MFKIEKNQSLLCEKGKARINEQDCMTYLSLKQDNIIIPSMGSLAMHTIDEDHIAHHCLKPHRIL